MAFLEAHNAWEREGGEPAPETEQPAAETETPAVETEEQPAETTEQAAPKEPEPEVTPEALNALINEVPELKAFLDGAPEKVKNTLFQMARTNARAQGVLKHIPNEEAAAFAAETSNRFVNIRTNFMGALENPESMPEAFAAFADEFAQRKEDGTPVLDEGGNPVYDDDFHLLNDHIVDTYHDVEIGDLEARIADNTLSEEDREGAEMTLMALKHIKEWRAGRNADPKKPNTDGMTPEAKAYFEQKERELAERESKLGGAEKKQTVAERKGERQTFETNVARKVGGSVGKRLGDMIAEDEKAGVFIPSIVTETKDPETGISIFAQTLLDKFQEKTYGRVDRKTGKVMGGVAAIRDKMARLANRPPSPDAEAARVKYALELVDEFLPAIYEQEKRSVQNKEIADRAKRQTNQQARERLTTPEPRGGGAVTPKSYDAASAMQEAYKWVDEKFPDVSPVERTTKALLKKDELLQGKR